MLVKIRWGLQKIRDDQDDFGDHLPSPFQIAAQATLLLVEKYLDLMLNTELYVIATGVYFYFYYKKIQYDNTLLFQVMSPSRKLKFFKDWKFDAADIRKFKAIVKNRWDESYKGQTTVQGTAEGQAKKVFFIVLNHKYIYSSYFRNSHNLCMKNPAHQTVTISNPISRSHGLNSNN